MAADVESIVLDPSFAHTEVHDDLAAVAVRDGLELAWHGGSELLVNDVPHRFRGPQMPGLARRVAYPGDVVDARRIGMGVCHLTPGPAEPGGDPPGSELQLLKYLCHTLLVYGHDAAPT